MQRSCAHVWLACALALGVPSIAAAEIYKCVAKSGVPLYQNFPCQFDSIGTPPGPNATKPPAAPVMPVQQVVPVPTVPPVQAANQTPPKPEPVNLAATAADIQERMPKVGMTPDQIRSILGEPLEIVPEEGQEGAEVWRYTDREIRLDRNQRVIAIGAW